MAQDAMGFRIQSVQERQRFWIITVIIHYDDLHIRIIRGGDSGQAGGEKVDAIACWYNDGDGGQIFPHAIRHRRDFR